MASGILMPKAGITVESCIVGKWHKNVGDTVAIDDVLFDYETDKAAFECLAAASGTLLAIFANSGDEVACLATVGVIGTPGEDFSELQPTKQLSSSTVVPSVQSPQVKTISHQPTGQAGSTTISPRASALTEKMKVNPASLIASGPDGRIIQRDVETASALNDDSVNAPIAMDYDEEVPSQIRKKIATAMFNSLAEMAQLTHHHSCDASKILALRKTLKAKENLQLQGISLNDIIMYCVIQVLLKHNYFNATFVDGIIRKYHHVNLGMAVDTPRGLIVPTIFEADLLSLSQLSNKAKELADLARSGAINPDLLTGGSFTVSNLGQFGVEIFTPIINPPQTAILGVCNINTRLKESAEGSVAYPALGLSLTYDHRVIDGGQAAVFMQGLVNYISDFSWSPEE